MKYFFLICLGLLFTSQSTQAQESNKGFHGETIQFNSGDGIRVTADVYMTESADAPFILLFHQAGYSRGEYREIAPRLNAMGYNCMAVDQRSGKEVVGVQNLTHEMADENNRRRSSCGEAPTLLL